MKKLYWISIVFMTLIFSHSVKAIKVCKRNGYYGATNTQGEVVIPFIYDAIRYASVHNAHNVEDCEDLGTSLLAVCKNFKWGVISADGDVLLPMEYDEIGVYHAVYNGTQYPIRAKKNKWGYIDGNREIMIPFIYDDALDFHQRYEIRSNGKKVVVFTPAAVKKNGKWALIDKSNTLLTEFKYDQIKEFELGQPFTSARKGDKWGFLDSDGKEISQFIYEKVVWGPHGGAPHGSMAIVQLNGKQGAVNEYGELKIPCVYKLLTHFNRGMVTAVKNDAGQVGAINRNGEIVVPLSSNNVIESYTAEWKLKDKSRPNNTPLIYDEFGNVYSSYEELRKKYVQKDLEPTPPTPSSTKPELEWLGLTNSNVQNYKLDVGVKSESQITDKKVYLNGSLLRGVVPITNDGYDARIKYDLSLREGDNTIKVEVSNTHGTSSVSKTVTYYRSTPPSITTMQGRVSCSCIALVIGNANYSGGAFSPLINPENDANDVSNKLESLGCRVVKRSNLSRLQFGREIDDFVKLAKNYEVAMIYYSGHAVEIDGVNYLGPVDAKAVLPTDLPYECINVNDILEKLEKNQVKANIIVLDCCRNNPKAKTKGYASGGIAGILAPSGTYIMYAAEPGKTSLDGNGHNSPFTAAFLQCLEESDLLLEMFAKKIRSIVREKTKDFQKPWTSGGFDNDFYFNKKK